MDPLERKKKKRKERKEEKERKKERNKERNKERKTERKEVRKQERRKERQEKKTKEDRKTERQTRIQEKQATTNKGNRHERRKSFLLCCSSMCPCISIRACVHPSVGTSRVSNAFVKNARNFHVKE